MKALTRATLSVLATLLCAWAARAQDAPAPSRFAPEGEGFAVEMPRTPSSSPERVKVEGLAVAGRRHEAADEGGRRYVVWSLDDPADTGRRLAGENYTSEVFGGEALYLDLIAEVAWQLVVEPEVERGKREGRVDFPQMAYGHEFRLDGKPAREYTFISKKTAGPVYVCADGPRVYVVAALGGYPPDASLKQFVQSFTLNPGAPATQATDAHPGTGTGRGLGTGTGAGTGGGLVTGGPASGADGQSKASGPVDYNRTFRQSEVVKKALITAKPEPAFTEQARKFTVTGVVRLRVVLSKTGEVSNVSVIKGLPHGLTSKAVLAARAIKFEPAQKDGRAVSQYVTIEYNFNIY
ncbi:MAG TPA: energy transducer TonB [Pyrinomonadaceae bacterium]|jgi:TonB family protein|nr:energy transducer TonB [Pyrinomonadaceae bacterium]